MKEIYKKRIFRTQDRIYDLVVEPQLDEESKTLDLKEEFIDRVHHMRINLREKVIEDALRKLGWIKRNDPIEGTNEYSKDDMAKARYSGLEEEIDEIDEAEKEYEKAKLYYTKENMEKFIPKRTGDLYQLYVDPKFLKLALEATKDIHSIEIVLRRPCLEKEPF